MTHKQIRMLKIATSFAALIIALVFVGIYKIVPKQNEQLLNNGIRQDIVVVDKYKRGTRKNPSYHMKVAWFTEGEEIPVYESKDTAGMDKSEKFSDNVLAEVFKGKKRTKLGDYKSFQLKFINDNSYQNLKVGDVATLVYLDGKPADGRLLREISKKNQTKHKKSEL